MKGIREEKDGIQGKQLGRGSEWNVIGKGGAIERE
jgi:hypothetical protein